MLSDPNSPQLTSETPQGAPASTDTSIPASAEKSNHQIPELRSKFDGLTPGDRRAQEMKASAADSWETGEGDFINAAIMVHNLRLFSCRSNNSQEGYAEAERLYEQFNNAERRDDWGVHEYHTIIQ